MSQQQNSNAQDTAESLGLVEFVAGYKSSKLKSGDSLRVHIPPTLSELKRGGYFIVQFRRIDDGTAELLARASGSKPTKMAKRTRAKSQVQKTKLGKKRGRPRKVESAVVSRKKKTSSRKGGNTL